MPEKVTGREKQPFVYELLKQTEMRVADRNEVIHIIGLKKNSPEFFQLQTAGVDLIALEEGRVTRGELLDAGYVFLNRLGAGEKPILNAIIPYGKPEERQTLAIGSKVLLDKNEFDAVLQYQQQHPEEYGTNGIEIGELRRDMMTFFGESLKESEDVRNKAVSAFRAAQGKIIKDPKYAQDVEILKIFFDKLLKDTQSAGQVLNYIMDECLAGINLTFVRGIPVDVVPQRLSKLSNAPSPFLDSGFHFDVNYDITLYTHDATKTRRLNMPVIHLLARGLNEMGGSLNDSHDQQYITSGQYAREIYPNKPSSENITIQSTTSEETIDLIAFRLLFRAREYLKC